MKVLFAVNNDEISNAIIKTYQKEYKEILSYKNVYYFNAILKELQKDKTYDRVVISEDLEPFANNNYDAIDKFLFDKLDNISDEATNENGKDTDIIIICTDRRSKSDDMLIKLFGIGIYNAIVGRDRSIKEVCRLINRPRTKKDAKIYYVIEAENVNYQTENENSVSETEVQNILAHYGRIGKNEEKYVESFNNIVSQYNDNQLKIIIKYLPIGVKAVLEEKSPKYQQLVGLEQNTERIKKSEPKEKPIMVSMLDDESEKKNMKNPIVIPSAVNKGNVKKLINQEKQIEPEEDDEDLLDDLNDSISELEDFDLDEPEEIEPKKGRGRPKKNIPESEQIENKPKRGRGRPKKNMQEESVLENDSSDEIDLFNLSDEENEEEIDLFNLEDEENDEEVDLFNSNDSKEDNKVEENEEDDDEEIDLFNLNDENDEEDEEENDEIGLFDDTNNNKQNDKQEDELDLFNLNNNENTISGNVIKPRPIDFNNHTTDIAQTSFKEQKQDNTMLLTKDKKIVSFVGTTKNGTSFIVNNVAQTLAARNIKTAILDLTKTRNAYYIYTNSDEKLIEKAKTCIYNLKSGIADGIVINKNLSVYTSVPEDDADFSRVDEILETLANNYSVVLIDCDFDTPMEYFDKSQETYLVQSMDVLTMQPLTAFLRNLQSKGILRPEKLRVVINKGVKIKSVSIKTLIGGISKYNDPSMTYMKDLFDKDNINYCVVPFDTQNYTKYLDSVITCSVTLNGYTKPLIAALNELGNMIYPVINNKTYTPRGDAYKDNFSDEMNDTLSKMKKYQ